MKRALPTPEEVEVCVRAIEAGAFDDLVRDFCCRRPARAVERFGPAFGRLVGRPLLFDRAFDVWRPVRQAVIFRYATLLKDCRAVLA